MSRENLLRDLRGLGVESCQSASLMPPIQFVRVVSRALTVTSEYEAAIILYCREYFDARGIEPLNVLRHNVCNKLRQHQSCVLLWHLYLDSPTFSEHFKARTGDDPPDVRKPGQKRTLATYTEILAKRKMQTLLEERGGRGISALRQQVKSICWQAKEVDLVTYDHISQTECSIVGRPELHHLFTRYLARCLD